MDASRAIVVLGMHRNGTSLATSGLQALGVYLGDDLFEGKPDNPTGYWEDKTIVGLNERVLKTLGLKWDSGTVIGEDQWQMPELEAIRNEAIAYLRIHFAPHHLWGFKDPRTLRLFPFWHAVFQTMGVDDAYVVIIRNPLSVAGSLHKRQGMRAIQAHLLWLVHMVPDLRKVFARPAVVVDYDLLMAEPQKQLERIAQRLQIAPGENTGANIERFATSFLDRNLRHNTFGPDDFDSIPRVSSLTRDAYRLLYRLATDRVKPDSERFWSAWEGIRSATTDILHEFSSSDMESGQEKTRPRANRSFIRGTDAHLFAVVGYQRTGSILLRELLNSTDQIATFTEVLLPSPAQTFRIGGRLVAGGIYPFDNFLAGIPSPGIPFISPRESESLLDDYFEYIHHHLREHPANSAKSQCPLIGINIKYSQLKEIAPPLWDTSGTPFLMSYLKSRGVTLIHTTRKNVIHCALSAIIAEQRNVWHNFEGAVVDRTYPVDVEECLTSARRCVKDHEWFLKFAKGITTIECDYDALCADVARAGTDGTIPGAPGPLRDIAGAFEIPFQFRYDGRLRKAIDIPYSQLISNLDELLAALRHSEFSAFAETLGNE